MHSNFANLVKELRIANRLTLREFCQQIGFDPSNWSKVERGINPPPSDVTILKRLSSFFELNNQKKQELLDAAALDRKELPKDLAENAAFMNALPAFFRAARGHELSPEMLKEFAADIRKLNQPDPEP